MDYGKALRVARALAGIQQKELAETARLDASYVSLIEMGKRKPSLRAVRALSQALEIPQDLFTLLATEKDDLEWSEPAEVEKLGKLLTELLLSDCQTATKISTK